MTNYYNFFKLQGAGNDFILFDTSCSAPGTDFLVSKAPWMCDRRLGIGADGILLISSRDQRSFELRYFNRDGSEVAFCGNGLRAAAWYLSQKENRDGIYHIFFNHNLFSVEVSGQAVVTPLPFPYLHQRWLWQDKEVTLIVCGVPHLIVFMRQEESVDVNYLGKAFAKRCREELLSCKIGEKDPLLGVNVNFVWVLDRQSMCVKTYENGVEEETLSCASGSSAASFLAHLCGFIDHRVSIVREGKELFQIEIDPQQRLLLAGSAEVVFQGRLSKEQVACL